MKDHRFMKNSTPENPSKHEKALAVPIRNALMTAVLLFLAAGCGTSKEAGRKNNDFFTSGSREADQRASQRMAKAEQLSGSGEGAGEKDVKKAEVRKSEGTGAAATPGTVEKGAQAEGKLTLYQRLGGEKGIAAIVDDFIPRALQDPRVNWERKGVKKGGLFSRDRQEAMWQPSAQNVSTLKKHIAQFLSLATGGPSKYEGEEMKQAHEDLHITNPEFDAAVGDLKASLDRLQIPNKEQKELLAIIESTRPQVVTER